MNTTSTQRLDQLWERGREFLGTRYAIMGGAMSWISERNLVSALSNAGGFGVIACGSMGPELLEPEIIATRQMTDKPFGVNLITMHPLIDELVDVCLRQRSRTLFWREDFLRAQPLKNLKKVAQR